MRRTSPLASALYDTEIDSAAEDALANRQVASRFGRKIIVVVHLREIKAS
jgi:hypothetical protein